ncbi:estrogen sulfotransferase [Ceratitis capitata]|uniref:estrogen sulfotransferase n=1 Tax=Ceratitis capitata TaxID=7213 RepID=UPI0006187E9C|nr:estrogen sulfotransferase [Ceratitis capitata]
MLYTKPLPSATDELFERSKRMVIHVSTNGKFIPLKWNWPETWISVPAVFKDNFSSIYDFEVRNDDVFIVTFPKSGTTWLQEASWLLLNKLDYEEAKRRHLLERSVFMDISTLYGEKTNKGDSVAKAAELKSPRCIKSHLPAHLLPRQIWQKKVKLIYCARNPKDVVLSYGHFLRGKGAYNGSMEEFIDDFLNAETLYSPYWIHVYTMWQMRAEPNIFFTTYEEMKQNLRGVVERLNEFLEQPPLSEAQMEKLLNHLSFESMKANQQVNPTEVIKKSGRPGADFQFMRRGIVGSYKDELSVRNKQRINEWSEQYLNKFNIKMSDIFSDF